MNSFTKALGAVVIVIFALAAIGAIAGGGKSKASDATLTATIASNMNDTGYSVSTHGAYYVEVDAGMVFVRAVPEVMPADPMYLCRGIVALLHDPATGDPLVGVQSVSILPWSGSGSLAQCWP